VRFLQKRGWQNLPSTFEKVQYFLDLAPLLAKKRLKPDRILRRVGRLVVIEENVRGSQIPFAKTFWPRTLM
jgi:hypothetical protein